MRTILQLAVLCVAAALAACSVKPVTFTQGDGQAAEDCDAAGDEDGNGLADCSDPACASTPSCQPACGNGVVDPGEQCDDGNTVGGDGCSADCRSMETCGNGVVDVDAQGRPIEECDDGNTSNTDGCRNDCIVNRCGDGFVNQAMGPGREDCDPAPPAGPGVKILVPTETASCNVDCTTARCGDGKVNLHGGEQCDDGNAVNGDACDVNCTVPRCGNTIVDPGEECDDGNQINGDSCEANCTLPRCGNGILDSGEECDDGNTADGDGCDSNCRIVACTTNLVPTMTSPTSPSGVVSRSGALDAGDEAWQAFDANTNSMWISAAFQTPAWIAYQWGDGPRNVTSYAITFVNGSLTTRAPRDWTFEGWNGSSWNVIDTRSAQTNWLGVERRAYTVTSPSSYSMYRLNVSDDNDSTAGVVVISMGRLEFMGCPP